MTTLAAFDPDSKRLLRRIAPEIDAGMLLEIAKADYEEDVDENLAALRELTRDELLPRLAWHPGEVLELIRWSEPTDPTHQPGSFGDRGQWIRLFATTVLVATEAEPGSAGYANSGVAPSVIQLIESIAAVAPDAAGDASALLARYIETHAIELVDPDTVYVGAALLALALKLTSIGEEAIRGLCDWISLQSERWPEWDVMLRSKWHRLGEDIIAAGASLTDPDTRALVELVGASLARDRKP